MPQYYIANSVLEFEEDNRNEFKGHMNLSIDEVPPHCVDPGNERPTRQPISKCINGFVNSGLGGVIYLGVDDSRVVKGIILNQYKMDHFLMSLRDLMSRYKPPVEPHRYHVNFVPVVSGSDADIKSMVSFDPATLADPIMRRMKHILRSYTYCWCDKELFAQHNAGVFMPEYIIEVHIEAWDRHDVRNKNGVGILNAHPIHRDENGKVYLRRNSGVVECTNDIRAIALDLVESQREMYQELIESLKKEQKKEKKEEI